MVFQAECLSYVIHCSWSPETILTSSVKPFFISENDIGLLAPKYMCRKLSTGRSKEVVDQRVHFALILMAWCKKLHTFLTVKACFVFSWWSESLRRIHAFLFYLIPSPHLPFCFCSGARLEYTRSCSLGWTEFAEKNVAWVQNWMDWQFLLDFARSCSDCCWLSEVPDEWGLKFSNCQSKQFLFCGKEEDCWGCFLLQLVSGEVWIVFLLGSFYFPWEPMDRKRESNQLAESRDIFFLTDFGVNLSRVGNGWI